jgi:Family of unknown function (DUF5906)
MKEKSTQFSYERAADAAAEAERLGVKFEIDERLHEARCILIVTPQNIGIAIYTDLKVDGWDQSDTYISKYMKRPATYPEILKRHGAVVVGNVATFSKCEQAVAAAKEFEFDLVLLDDDRPVNFIIKNVGDGIEVTAEAARKGNEVPRGWGFKGRKLLVQFSSDVPVSDANPFDHVRHVKTADGDGDGYLVKGNDGDWTKESYGAARDVLRSACGYPKPAAEIVMGNITRRTFVQVMQPYQSEFLAGDQWNKGAAQLIDATDGGFHPHYDLIYSHLGRGLDDAVGSNAWCYRNGIHTGRDYLMQWSASVVQAPSQHLPGLFFFSPDTDNGKSTFWESHKFWIERGVVDGALAMNEKFNKKLCGAVIAYLDDQAMNPAAMGKAKNLITADAFDMRKMRVDAVDMQNFTHWIFTGNDLSLVPLEKNDTRFVVIEVPTLFEEEKIAWPQMREHLQREASDFLGTLLSINMRPPAGRLYLPPLTTDVKRKLLKITEFNPLEFVSRVQAIIGDKAEVHFSRSKLVEVLGDGSWSSQKSAIVELLLQVSTQLKAVGIRFEFTKRWIYFHKGAVAEAA